MDFREIIRRIGLTGLSVGPVGAQWNLQESERAVARRVIAFMENRRVLYGQHDLEEPTRCAHSLYQIRDFLTEQIGELSGTGEIEAHLKAMRAACRLFLDTAQREMPGLIKSGEVRSEQDRMVFYSAFGQLRATIGLQIAQLAAKFQLDVEDELASIFPGALDE